MKRKPWSVNPIPAGDLDDNTIQNQKNTAKAHFSAGKRDSAVRHPQILRPVIFIDG